MSNTDGQDKQDKLLRTTSKAGLINLCKSRRNQIDALQSEVELLRDELAKLAAFKKYVHDRLDEAGVPVDPDSPHKEHGCRIGGRLDHVFNELAELKRKYQ